MDQNSCCAFHSLQTSTHHSKFFRGLLDTRTSSTSPSSLELVWVGRVKAKKMWGEFNGSNRLRMWGLKGGVGAAWFDAWSLGSSRHRVMKRESGPPGARGEGDGGSGRLEPGRWAMVNASQKRCKAGDHSRGRQCDRGGRGEGTEDNSMPCLYPSWGRGPELENGIPVLYPGMSWGGYIRWDKMLLDDVDG